MSTNRFKKLTFLVLLLPALACGPFAAGAAQPAETINALYTSAAATLNALSTQAAFTSTSLPIPTGTLSINTATLSPVNTATTVPSPLPIIRCDAASFVSDVTFSDGAVVGRGTSFTKIWRIKNVGTCAWTTSYAIVFVSGESFAAPSAMSMPVPVGPGQTIDIAINLTAPGLDGHYRGNWKLRNNSGGLFGVGTNADTNFYVDVNVSGYTLGAYDFVASFCDAVWRSESKTLDCPGSQGDDRGFVRMLAQPKMEDGIAHGDALITYPNKSGSGFITGKYPNFNVKPGDRFQALIGCQHQATDCNVIYRLQYQIGNGEIKTLAQWHEVYEGLYYAVSVDLSPLGGEKVKFVLTVLANGTSHDDFALWVNPRITRQGAQPPTATFTATPSSTATATASSTPTMTPTSTATSTPTSTPTSTITATSTP